jgi:tetratricopeptide (TPR) repeat protein
VAYLGLLEWLMSRGEDASDLLSEARARFPGNLHLVWLEGRHLMKRGHYRQAIDRFEQLAGAWECADFNSRYGNSADDPDHWFGYDERLFNVLSFDSLATCHLCLEQYEDSLRYLEMAERHQPASRELLLKRYLCLNLLRRAKPGSR